MLAQRVRRNSIHLERIRNWKGQLVWRWSCDVHIRSRGYHSDQRWADRWRRSRDLPPDTHPWLRCIEAANAHHHRYHSTCPHREVPACRSSLKPN